jgi:hypothetical protein
MSRCAETVEDDNCLWKRTEKRKTISCSFFELLALLLLVAFAHMHGCLSLPESMKKFFVEKLAGRYSARLPSATSVQWLKQESSKGQQCHVGSLVRNSDFKKYSPGKKAHAECICLQLQFRVSSLLRLKNPLPRNREPEIWDTLRPRSSQHYRLRAGGRGSKPASR